MKIEYLADGSPECPLPRIFGADPSGAVYLTEAFGQLADGLTEMIAVHELPGIEPIGECRFIARVGDEDRGLQASRAPGLYDMVLTPPGWDQVTGLVEPFCEPAHGDTHFQWLSESGEVKLLITTSETGEWSAA